MSQSQKTYQELLSDAIDRGIQYDSREAFQRRARRVGWKENTVELFLRTLAHTNPILIGGCAVVVDCGTSSPPAWDAKGKRLN